MPYHPPDVCPHCEHEVKRQDPAIVYPVSRQRAHLRCTSVPSIEDIDELLLARAQTRSAA